MGKLLLFFYFFLLSFLRFVSLAFFVIFVEVIFIFLFTSFVFLFACFFLSSIVFVHIFPWIITSWLIKYLFTIYNFYT